MSERHYTAICVEKLTGVTRSDIKKMRKAGLLNAVGEERGSYLRFSMEEIWAIADLAARLEVLGVMREEMRAQ